MRVRSGLLEVRDVSVAYGDVVAVAGASLEVDRGEIAALVGPSGCGKTSLLRAVAGFEEPTGGSVALDGELVVGAGRFVPPERRRIGMVFQQGALFPHLTVGGNVAYGLGRRSDAAERVSAVLELVGMEELVDRYPDELSGGQQQRVGLARALAPEPRLILLDEPFAALDAGLRERLRTETVEILRAAGATAVLVTHDREEALSVADRVAVMSGGRILQTGPPQELYRRPASPEVARFLGSGLLAACEVEDGTAASRWGTFACDAPDGPALALLRPEDFRLAPGDEPGIPGTLAGRTFYGHDVLDRVRLEDGEEVEVRVLSSATLPVGASVRLTLRPGRYRTYPA